MIKTFYIQKDEKNRITDIVSNPHEDYIPVELNTPLPPMILGGCYELLADNSIIYRREWDMSILELDTRLAAMSEAEAAHDMENKLAIAELAETMIGGAI